MTNHCPEHTKFQYKCRECCRIYQRHHYHTNKERYQKLNADRYQERKEHYNRNGTVNARKRLFGIDQEAFNQMLNEQKSLCGICYNKIDNSACVDHNHETGKVRGLLCRKCNMGLGLFNDDRQLITSADSYLERTDG